MPTSTREILLGRYHYDPLDRLVDCAPFEQAAIQRYYCKTRLSTELQGTTQRTIVQHDDQLLAQQKREGGKMTTALLATDQQRSVLNALDADRPHPLAYTPYGHRPPENGLLSLLGFTGERPDPVTGHYHLGNGYRQFNPVLMRFNSPDSWSPFGKGGVNAYAYCGGDPVNRVDPNGHKWNIFLELFSADHIKKIPRASLKNINRAHQNTAKTTKPTALSNKPVGTKTDTVTTGTSHTTSSPVNLAPKNKTTALQYSDMANLRKNLETEVTQKISNLNKDINYHNIQDKLNSRNTPWNTDGIRAQHQSEALRLNQKDRKTATTNRTNTQF